MRQQQKETNRNPKARSQDKKQANKERSQNRKPREARRRTQESRQRKNGKQQQPYSPTHYEPSGSMPGPQFGDPKCQEGLEVMALATPAVPPAADCGTAPPCAAACTEHSERSDLPSYAQLVDEPEPHLARGGNETKTTLRIGADLLM